MRLLLSSDELFEITGRTQPAAQIKHLRRMGIRAERSANPDNPVCVLRAWLAQPVNDSAQSKPRLKSDQRAA